MSEKKKVIKRTRRKKNKNQYFTKEHENAITQYALSTSNVERTRLYAQYIEPAFDTMVNKIIYTYKFTMLPNIEPLSEECKIWLTTILDKFDPEKGSKAFSYFSVITKNWFIHKVKKNSKKSKREIQYENLPKELEYEFLQVSNDADNNREKEEFFYFLMKEIADWEYEAEKECEKDILEAIKILLKDANNIEIFNKKAVYLYIREITGLNTKQIVGNLNRIRKKYKEFKQDWNNGEI